jgi:hypothetical protein
MTCISRERRSGLRIEVYQVRSGRSTAKQYPRSFVRDLRCAAAIRSSFRQPFVLRFAAGYHAVTFT